MSAGASPCGYRCGRLGTVNALVTFAKLSYPDPIHLGKKSVVFFGTPFNAIHRGRYMWLPLRTDQPVALMPEPPGLNERDHTAALFLHGSLGRQALLLKLLDG